MLPQVNSPPCRRNPKECDHMQIDSSKDLFCIDSKPVKTYRNARAKRCAIGRDNINAVLDWGYCASQGMYYFGYKLHVVYGIGGVIHSYDMTATSVHDLLYLKDIRWKYHDHLMLRDKGYLRAEVQKDLFEVANRTFEVPYRLNQRDYRPTADTVLTIASRSRP